MPQLLIRNARVLAMRGENEKPLRSGAGRRGRDVGNLHVIPRADVLIESSQILEVIRDGSRPTRLRDGFLHEVDAHGCVLMPGFVDCHTHACFAGSRIDEWERRLAGESYQDIQAAGGGILSTVRATRASEQSRLETDLLWRLDSMLHLGSTTIEVKSGYGLTAEAELKMLNAVTHVGEHFPGTVVPTALLGHALDPAMGSHEQQVKQTVEHILPEVAAKYPKIAVDAFCEQGAWTRADCEALFKAAKAGGHPVRVHTDQFSSQGMVESAIQLGAASVDHLEATTPATLKTLAQSETFGVMLPAASFHLDMPYANARGFLDAGGKLALATNFNPGSAPCPSMSMVIALAVREMKLTPAEAIGAATINPAALLGFTDRGWIGAGARAEAILLNSDDERALAYEFGASPVELIILGNRVIEA